MARVKRGVTQRARHKEMVKAGSGYRGRASRVFRVAIEKVEKGLRYAYRDRRNRKRDMRSLWIQRINAAARANGLTYGRFIEGVRRAGIALDRKVLADIAAREPAAFQAIAEQARAALKA